MNKRMCFGMSVVLVGVLLGVAGCNTQRDEGTQRATLKAGAQVAEDMGGWVAVPNTSPKEISDPAQNFSYARLATHNIVPGKMEGWYAMSPKLFERVTGIKLAPLNTQEGELWAMRVGRRVPKDKEGWVGVAPTYPRLEKQGQEAGLAMLGGDQIIPKELDGWAAVDKETMVKLAEQHQLKGVTIKEKKKAEAVTPEENAPEPKKPEAVQQPTDK